MIWWLYNRRRRVAAKICARRDHRWEPLIDGLEAWRWCARCNLAEPVVVAG